MFGGDGMYHPPPPEPAAPAPPGPPAPPPPEPAAPSAPAGGDDVVPIAGDSAFEAPQPPPGSDSIYEGVDDVVGGIVDLDAPPSLYGPPPELVAGLVGWVKSAPKWVIPALLAIVVVIIVAVFALGGSSKSASPPSAAPTTSTTSSTSTSTSTPTTTASAPAPAPPPQDVVSLGLSLGQSSSGTTTPLLITVQAAPNAPGVEKVTLAFTGAGMPGSYTVSVAPGKSVTHTFVGTGCGSWTVRIASVNGTVVHAAGNPNLENGATHKC